MLGCAHQPQTPPPAPGGIYALAIDGLICGTGNVPKRFPRWIGRFTSCLGWMKHILKNLLLLPFRLAWDIFLVAVTLLIAVNIYCWACATFFGIFIIFALLVSQPHMLLLPCCLLAYLKHPWPKPNPPPKENQLRKSIGRKLILAVLL